MQLEPLSIPINSIDFDGRVRTDYGDIESTRESIREIGVIQPIVLNRDENGKYKLAAGGRRTRCILDLGFTHVFEGVTCDPQRPGFVFRENMREDEILEVELEENLQRKGFTWAEEVLMVAKVHAAKTRNAALNQTNWGMRQTGKLLGVALGHVHNILSIAAHIKAGDQEVIKSGGITDAIKVLMERKENEAQKLIAQRSGVTIGKNDLAPLASTADPLHVDIPSTSPVQLLNKTEGMATITPKERMSINLSNHLKLGDSIDDILPRWPDGCVDHIVTDIPYGIDMDNLEGMVNLSRVKNEHDVGENVALMPRFLKQAYRLIRDGGYCVFFYDLDHHEKLQGWAIEEGFKVQRWPIVWVKTHRCKNEAAAFNWTKSTEFAMVLRKGNATLVKPQGTNVVTADGAVERKLYDNPFAKPFLVWKTIYDAIAIQGQSVLDPFAGEMSAVRAAIICGLKPYAVELSDKHFNRGIEQVKEAYRLLTAGNVEFTQ